MSTELTVLNNNEGNANLASRFFRIKPGTLTIVQPNSAKGTRGNLIITETGQEFKEMRVALLVEPVDQRGFYIGEGEMNRKPENLMCFTKNVVYSNDIPARELQGPDTRSKVPQAMRCNGCANSSWDKWKQNKIKSNLPPCDLYTYAFVVDTVTRLPLQLYVRSKNKKPWEKGMDNIARTLMTQYSQDGKTPNFFNVSFTLSTEPLKNDNGLTTYILKLSDFAAVSEEEREAFGEVYKRFTNKTEEAQQAALESEAADQMEENNTSIDNAVTGEYISEDEVITI